MHFWVRLRCLGFFVVLAGVTVGCALSTRTVVLEEEKNEKPSPSTCLKIGNKASLVHLGSLDSFDRTEKGTDAAKLVLDAALNKNRESAKKAIALYEKIIPNENFGGEYTALQWMCEYLVASPDDQKKMLADKYVRSFHEFFAKDNYAVLKEYINTKYKLIKDAPKETDESIRRQRFHEDFILFNNPRRERWEKSTKMIAALGLKEGDVVADIGSGPGYFSFKFADIVGPKGRVYAIDTNEYHIDYVKGLIKKFDVANVLPITSTFTDIRVPKGVKVDCAYMCSLYHVVYCTDTEEERVALLDSIKRCLKPDGTLVIVDNALVEDATLPYHGPHIAHELITAQLKYHGFTLKATHQFIPQRYMLVFKLGEEPPAKGPVPCDDKDSILIKSPASLVQYVKPGPALGGMITGRGRRAAKAFYQALDKNDFKAATSARDQLEKILNKEHLGNEYSAFIWFCDYLLADKDKKKEMLQDKYVRDYFEYLGGEKFTELKKYVWNKYLLAYKDEEVEDPPGTFNPKTTLMIDITQDQLANLHEFIAFNNPRRETWEKTSKTIEFLKTRVGLKPGTAVADIGCGPGFYTYKFSEIVGDKGQVYAVDTSKDILDHVYGTAKKHRVENIFPIPSTYDNAKLPKESVDVVYLCSLYHAVYATSMEPVRDRFIQSLKGGMRKGAKLVIVDNDLVEAGQVAYAGPRIDRRLIIHQLKHYGLELVDSTQIIPQRYILVFEVKK